MAQTPRFALPSSLGRRVRAARRSAAPVILALATMWPAAAHAQITAVARPGNSPYWDKGMIPINAESYYHAIDCGKQGGDDPPCVFWDTGLCKNDDFSLAFHSGYKQVAYEVWMAVRRKKPAPQPSYQAAQRTRVTVGVTPVPGSHSSIVAREYDIPAVVSVSGACQIPDGTLVTVDGYRGEVIIHVGKLSTL